MQNELVQKFNNKKSIVITLIICICLLLTTVVMVLLNHDVLYNDDLIYHAPRIKAMADAIRGGQFPIKYYNDWLYGGAYLGSLFYGDFFLILPSLLVVIGVPLNVAYYGFLFLLQYTMGILMYFLANKYLKNDWLSIIIATMFCLSQYVFVDIFRRGAVGESISIIFFIVLFLAFYNMLYENYSKPWLYSIAYLGFLLSHFTSLFFGLIALIVVVLFNCKKLFTNKYFYIKSLLALGIFFVIGLYSILSFIEMYFADTYWLSNPWTLPSDNGCTIIDMIGIIFPYGLGICCFIPLVLRLFLFSKKYKNENKSQLDKFIITSLILMFISSNIFPWKWFDKVLGFVQFPWRVNVIATICLILSFGIEIKMLFNTKISLMYTLIPLFVFMVFFNNLFLLGIAEDSSLTFPNTNHICFEFYPIEVESQNFEDRNIYNQDEISIQYTRRENSVETTFNSVSDDSYYIVPLVYYKGYSASIKYDNGVVEELNISKTDKAMIKVETLGKEGVVTLNYTGTPIQNVTFIISFVSSVVVLTMFITYYVLVKNNYIKDYLLLN